MATLDSYVMSLFQRMARSFGCPRPLPRVAHADVLMLDTDADECTHIGADLAGKRSTQALELCTFHISGELEGQPASIFAATTRHSHRRAAVALQAMFITKIKPRNKFVGR